MFFFIIINLIIQLNSIEFTLKKNFSIDNEFTPYIFNFTLNDNTFIVYPSIFDTTQFYILIQEEDNDSYIDSDNIIMNYYENYENNDGRYDINISGQVFHYFKEKVSYKEYLGIIGISNKNKNKTRNIIGNWKNYSYLYMLEREFKNISNYINFIQKESDEALIQFGEINPVFNIGATRRCSCKEKFWSCELLTLKIGGNEVCPSSGNEYAIFSISEEYIIAPYSQGKILLNFYKDLIEKMFGVSCGIKKGNYNLANLTCKYFNYEDLPDLSFVLKGGIKIMALSIDLFKILNDYSLEFKIKYVNTTGSNNNNWYLGEPVIKNYNFLLNYTDENDVELIIKPSSLNGFILIIVACVGGFLFLFLFLTIIYCVSKKDKKRKNYFSGWNLKGKKNSDYFYMAKNSYIQEKIEENEEEELKSEESENSEKSDNSNNSDNKDNKSNKSDDNKYNIEEKKLDDDEIEGSGLINEDYLGINIDDNLMINNTNNINNINNENNNRISTNQNNPINVELSINNYNDENEDEDDLMINHNNK